MGLEAKGINFAYSEAYFIFGLRYYKSVGFPPLVWKDLRFYETWMESVARTSHQRINPQFFKYSGQLKKGQNSVFPHC